MFKISQFIIEKTLASNFKSGKHPSHWCLSLPALHPRCCHQWSVYHCLDTDCCLTCFSEFSHLTPPICCHVKICPCTLLLFQHNAQMLLACNYSHIMLSIIDSSQVVAILPAGSTYLKYGKVHASAF